MNSLVDQGLALQALSIAECWSCLVKGRELTRNAAGRYQCDQCRANELREIRADERFELEHEGGEV